MVEGVTTAASIETDGLSWKRSLSPQLLSIAAITGIGCGLVCVGLRFILWFLQWLITGHSGLLAAAASHLPLWRRASTPVLGALAATLIVKAGATFSAQKKFVDYVDAVQLHNGRISFVCTFWKTASSALSIASGAAIGREGSMIQFAAAVTSAWGGRWRPRGISLERLVAFGSAAAVASVYQAPLAGAFFALEIVLGIGVLKRSSIHEFPALLISAVAGSLISHHLLGHGPLFPVGESVRFHLIDCAPVWIIAIAIGVLGPAYLHVMKGARFLRRWPLAMLWSGAVVGLVSCFQPEVWGNGDSGVLAVMSNKLTMEAAGSLLVLRLIATAACVGSGVAGGVFTPTVFAGSILGLLCGHFLRLLLPSISAPVSYAVVGIACLLTSVTHAPWMASFMTVELTGTPEWLPVVLFGSLTSSQVAKTIRSRSLYTAATPEPAPTADVVGTDRRI
jgi:chloride channel protein, CIC family